MRIVIVGAGGHAQVVADILVRRRSDGLEPVGYVDDNPSLRGRVHLGIPVLGSLADIRHIPHDAVIVAMGENSLRRRVFLDLEEQGEQFATACHPSAVIGSDVTIGAGSVICAGVVVNCCSTVGVNTILNTCCSLDHHNRIGGHSHIAPGSHTGGNVRVGESVLLGIGSTVLPGRTIGSGAVVGAGAVVLRDVPERAIAVGVPARLTGSLREGDIQL